MTEFTIGRASDNDLCIQDNRVSRKHAKMTMEGSRLTVTDLDSSGGTFLNGSRVKESNIIIGDDLRFSAAIKFNWSCPEFKKWFGSRRRATTVISTDTQLINNPISVTLSKLYKQMQKLSFDGTLFLPSLVTMLAILLAILVLVILWPFGWIPVFENFLRGLIGSTRNQMKQGSAFEKMPFTIAIGIYCLIWLPVGVLCIPFLLLGFVGSMIANE